MQSKAENKAKEKHDLNVLPKLEFDAHLIFQKMEKFGKKITSIADNMERCSTFTVGGIQFLDSYQFLNTNLERIPRTEFKYHEKVAKTEEQKSSILQKVL